MYLKHVADFHAAAVIDALRGSLDLTLDALADMYDRNDGPWLDELLRNVLNGAASGDGAGKAEVRQAVELFFFDFRRRLKPRRNRTPASSAA